ncbi:MAG TPA: ATP F0F1 synthase subunit B [Rhizomicrobium sp.]|nr:ATP F0F1 synthase subunit B [Rhizomicrobium sp.]
MDFLQSPETWVAAGFLVVILVLVFVARAPKIVAGMLDARAGTIKAELDEAKRLRDEAAQVLASYKAKAASAESEAQAILNDAKAEAARFATESRTALSQQIERRAKQAQDKIAQAEATAMAEIRALAADAAATAAQKLIAARMTENSAASLIASSIQSLGSKLN